MSVKELAIVNQGPDYYEFSSVFDGQRFFIAFNYNSRNDTWYMDLKDANRQTLLAGLACLTNVQQLTARFALDEGLLVGDILIADSNNQGIDPSFENFGDNVSAFYLSVVS